MGDVTTHITTPMQALYGDIQTDDADMVLDQYESALGAFSNATLQAAYLAVTKEFVPSKRVPWPAPAWFVKAARVVLEQTGNQSSGDDIREQWTGPIRGDAIAAREFINTSTSSLVTMALRDGWGKSLRDCARGAIRLFREKHGRRPTPAEMLGFRLPQSDCDYYGRYGQPFTRVDHDMIMAERHRMNLVPRYSSDRLTGDQS